MMMTRATMASGDSVAVHGLAPVAPDGGGPRMTSSHPSSDSAKRSMHRHRAARNRRGYGEDRASQLATSSRRRPLAMKLAATTQAKLATISGVGPKTLMTSVDTDRPVMSRMA